MRTTRFDPGGAGGGSRDAGGGDPRGAPRAARPARLALIVAILLLAFDGTAIAAAYEALEDMQSRGEMDPTW
jgi:hypothetical protein